MNAYFFSIEKQSIEKFFVTEKVINKLKQIKCQLTPNHVDLLLRQGIAEVLVVVEKFSALHSTYEDGLDDRHGNGSVRIPDDVPAAGVRGTTHLERGCVHGLDDAPDLGLAEPDIASDPNVSQPLLLLLGNKVQKNWNPKLKYFSTWTVCNTN